MIVTKITFLIICFFNSCTYTHSLDLFESSFLENGQSIKNDFLNENELVSEVDTQNLTATDICDTNSLLEERIQHLQHTVRQSDEKYLIVVKELEMARQIIGELNIKLATRDSEFVSLQQSHVSNQKNSSTVSNFNIEDVLLASIEESTQYIKELNGKLEDITTTANRCQDEKTVLTKEIAVFDVKSRIAKNEQNLARLSRDQCLLDIELLKAERNVANYSNCPYQFYYSNELKSCDIMSCLRTVSIRDVQNAISATYEDSVTNGIVPKVAQWRHSTINFVTSQIANFQKSGYPYIRRCLQFSWQHTYLFVSNAIRFCRYAWTSQVFPFFTLSLQPKMATFYSVYFNPFVTERIVPFYKLNIEESIDNLMQFITDFYYDHLDGLVTEYLEPAFEWTFGKVNYAVYFTIKYFEQDDWFEVTVSFARNVVHTVLENLADHFLVHSVCGVSHSSQCAAAIATVALLLVAWLLRTLLLGVAAAVLFLLLSPFLAVLYVLSKLVLFVLPSSSTTNSDKLKIQPLSSLNQRVPGDLKPRNVSVRRDESQMELRRSQDSLRSSSSQSSQHIAGRSRAPLQRSIKSMQPQQQQPSRAHPYTLSLPQSPRLNASHDSTSSYPYFIPTDNITTSASNSPYTKQNTRSNSHSSNISISYNATPSKASKLEQLRQRKSPGAVTLGLTPAAALGLVPIGKERNRNMEDDVEQDDDEGDSELYDERELEDDVGETGDDLEAVELDNRDASKDFSFADL